jgi:DNA repair protein RadC
MADDLRHLHHQLQQRRATRAAPAASSSPRSADLAGLAALGDLDLLALVAGREALTLLERHGSLPTLAELSPSALADAANDKTAGLRIGAAFELGQRARQRPHSLPTVANSADVARLMSPLIGALAHEEMWVLALDGRTRARGQRRVSQGGLHAASVTPVDVLRAGIAEAASSIVLVHNHPGGRPEPSQEDITLTRRMMAACEAVGMPLADHVIVTASGAYTSMRDLGVIADEVSPEVSPPRAGPA